MFITTIYKMTRFYDGTRGWNQILEYYIHKTGKDVTFKDIYLEALAEIKSYDADGSYKAVIDDGAVTIYRTIDKQFHLDRIDVLYRGNQQTVRFNWNEWTLAEH